MFSPRIFRSFQANYYEDDVLTGPDAYPDEYFAALVDHGFDAVWLRGILRNLASTSVFPMLGDEIARHQDALGTVIERARRHGVKVLLYLNEPLGLPAEDRFWSEHPDVRGARGVSDMDEWPEAYAFCTSTPEVRAWLREAAANLFRALPELSGWFLISASEHFTNCYSHTEYALGQRTTCPCCAERSAVEVVADVVMDLRDGTRAVSPRAHTIAWNWGWSQYELDPQSDLLARLPRDIALMLDFERGGNRMMPDGRPNFIDEYSLGYVGPSERFLATYEEAKRQGLSVMAKLQVGTTHELATVPNLPLVDHLYDKLVKAEELGLTGILATWNFGNAFSLNTAAVGRFVRTTERPTAYQFVTDLAAEYFPGADVDGVAAAVALFSTAMRWFPFDIDVLYWGPHNYAIAYPFTLEPLTGASMGWSWMKHERGDDLSKSAKGQFAIEEIADCYGRVVDEWDNGVNQLAEALKSCEHPNAAVELGVARAIGHCYRSARNVYQAYLLRRDCPDDAVERFLTILDDEIANLEEVLPLVEADSRLGFHAECQGYQFSPPLIERKLEALYAQRNAHQVLSWNT